MDELGRLAETAGARQVDRLVQQREAPTASHFFGRGKAAQLRDLARRHGADLVLFLNDLSPVQQRNLESAVGCLVLDRTALILDIFAQHAHTRDGKIQVELAQMRYLLPRLTGRGTILSRLGGGIGTRGPGETKLEMDRRRIRGRIARLKEEVEQIRSVRAEQRRRRQRSRLPLAGIVGYTNAGKSTLLNRLTHSQVYAADELFATLDPTTRRLDFDDGHSLLVSDTVGFITDLPRSLEAAFAATLEEITFADLLLHVVDLSSPRLEEEMSAVFAILQHLGLLERPMLTVFNKRDQAPVVSEQLLRRHAPAVAVSALTGEGMEALLSELNRLSRPRERELLLLLPHTEGRLRALLYESGQVLDEAAEEAGHRLRARVPEALAGPFLPFVV